VELLLVGFTQLTLFSQEQCWYLALGLIVTLYFGYIQILVVLGKIGKCNDLTVMLLDLLLETRFVVIVACLLTGSTPLLQLLPCILINVAALFVWLAASV
jgi:hypothetical protein